jgi:pantothenate kinase
METLALSPDAAVALIASRSKKLASPGKRVAVGLAGGPGAGKSTIAAEIVRVLNDEAPGSAALVPMDGFHMRQSKLDALGTAFEKGAPHTFEATAFVQFLGALKEATGPVSGPGYSRLIEDVVDDAFVVPGEARILVVEGNYLLLPDPPWDDVRPLLDLAIFLAIPRDRTLARLLARHNAEGLFDPAYSRRHVEEVDMRNLDLVAPTRSQADLAIELETQA